MTPTLTPLVQTRRQRFRVLPWNISKRSGSWIGLENSRQAPPAE